MFSRKRASWLRPGFFLMLLWPAPVVVAQQPGFPIHPPLAAAPTDPLPYPPTPAPLAAGQAVTLRVLQVEPADGLSPGERLLNGLCDIQVGDRFVAEVLDPPCPQPLLVGGKVTKVVRPGWFGRPGYVAVQVIQFVQEAEGGGVAPWQVDLRDRRLVEKMRRILITALLTGMGVEAGAVVGAQQSGGHVAWVAGGMGVGALVGAAYASLQRGVDARLEPGDTFKVVVGDTHYRPVPRDWQTILYPAPDPDSKKGKSK